MYKDKPILFSFIIPCLNEENDIEEVICACLAQNCYERFEILLINDGSTDRTRDIIDKYSSIYVLIKSFHFEENKGVCFARNYGVSKAAGEILIFLNADEIPQKDYLSKISVKYRNGADYFMPLTTVKNISSLYGIYREAYRRFKYPRPNDYLWSQGFSCRKSVFTLVGGFDERYPGCGGEDWDFVTKLEMKGLNRCVDFSIVVSHNVPNKAKDIIWHMYNRGRGSANFDIWRGKKNLYQYVLFKIITFILFLLIGFYDKRFMGGFIGCLLVQNLLVTYKMTKGIEEMWRYFNITAFYFAEKFLRFTGYLIRVVLHIKNRRS